MTEYISEQEILNLIKKLDQDPHLSTNEHLSLVSEIDNDCPLEDGYIKVDHGKIIVVNPSNGGKFPTIEAHHPITLFVDGQQINKRIKVSSESVIEWRIEEKPLFEIVVSDDNLSAYMLVHHTKRYSWVLDDQQATDLTLTAEKSPSIILKNLDLQDVLDLVENMDIKTNLDIPAIQAEILRPTNKPVEIATGKAPEQCTDAQLNIYFSENIEHIFAEVKGVIDYKNHMHIPSAKNGDVIASKTAPVEGKAGYDVFGNILLPDPVNDIRIVGKENVEITSENIVIARKEGRPRITGHKIKFFDINTAHIVPGNVDLSTGNIVFVGDVIVYGDVMDNMIIESLRNIYVFGSVYNSTLTATGSIAVKGNSIGSNLYSGYFGMLYNRLYNGSKKLIDYLEKMVTSVQLLLTEINKKKLQVRYGQALLLVIESKYQQAWEIVKELLSVIKSLQTYNHGIEQTLKDYLEIFLLPTKIVEVMTAPRMADFIRVLKEAYMRVALSPESQVQISINQAQNSVLKSNGDILIRKEGVIQCDLYSAANIIFFLDDSVCRGSKLEAEDTISAMYVGGITGVGTSLKAANKVIIKKLFEGRITVDRYSIDIFEPIEDMTFDYAYMKQVTRENKMVPV